MSAFSMALVALFGLACYMAGWRAAHVTVLDESERLRAFYVGNKIIVVKEIKEYKPEAHHDRAE